VNREARKKMLIVEGVVHRLELVQASRQLKQDVRPARLLSRLPALLTLVAQSKAMPLMGTALTLVAGKGFISRLLRRGLVVAGMASAAAVIVSRWRARREEARNPQRQ
jgi:Protein of unknown function (DUF3318)